MTKLKEYLKVWSWTDYGLVSLLIVFCAFNKLMPILMVVTFLSVVKFRNEFIDAKKVLSFKYPFIWMIVFYLIHLLGMVNTEKLDVGLEDIGMKLSFLLFPLFFVFAKIKLTKKQIIELYIAGVFLAVVICFGYAIFRSIYNLENNNWAFFTESYFSFMMHRSYFGTYLAIGTFFSVIYFFKYKFNKERQKLFFIFLPLLLFTSTLLTGSKAAIIILIVQLVPLTYYLISKYGKKIHALLGVFSLIIVLSVVLLTENRVNSRFVQMIKGVTSEKTIANTTVESNSSRLIMWSTSMQLIKENPIFGTGTGDINYVLYKRNYELENFGVADEKLNSHNQYLNTWVQLGLFGLIPLLMFLITSFKLAFKQRNLLLLLIMTSFSITMLFESFLETQAGIIPVIFLTLLFSRNTIDNDKNYLTE